MLMVWKPSPIRVTAASRSITVAKVEAVAKPSRAIIVQPFFSPVTRRLPSYFYSRVTEALTELSI